MNILIISYEYPPIGGGVGTALLYYVQALKETEHNIDIITPCDTDIYDEMNITDRITIKPVMICKKKRFSWTKKEMVSWVWNLWLETIYDKKKYDVIHYWGPFPAIYAPIIRNKKTPYIITFHGSDVPGRQEKFDNVYRFMVGYKRLCKKAVSCTAVSKSLAYKAEFWMGRTHYDINEKVEVIPNGIKSHPIPSTITENKLVTMSRLTPIKRVHMLIHAMKFLPDDYTLDIYGDGPDYIRLYDLARGICPDRIKFHGWVKNPSQLLPQYKIYVQASYDLGVTNISDLDALGYGLPIVRVEYIGTEQFKNAVVPSMSLEPDRLAKKILEVSTNYNYHKDAVRKVVEEKGWDHTAKQYIELYEKVYNV